MPKTLTELDQKDIEITFLKSGLKDTFSDLKMSKEIIEAQKTALDMADFIIEKLGKIGREKDIVLTIYKGIVSG